MNYLFQNRSYITLFFALTLLLISCNDDSGVTDSETPAYSSCSHRNGENDFSSSVTESSSSNIAFSYAFTDWPTCVTNGDCGTLIDTRETPAKTYRWVTIGTQTWMAENMAYMPYVNHDRDISRTEPKYYVYEYYGTDMNAAKKRSNFTTYGVLYNWIAAMTSCPTGWHLPSKEEWVTLAIYVVDTAGTNLSYLQIATAGIHLKAQNGWVSDSGKLNLDTHGFSALPGGRCWGSAFDEVGYTGYWWTATENRDTLAFIKRLYYNYASISGSGYFDKDHGLSVRCLKDENQPDVRSE